MSYSVSAAPPKNAFVPSPVFVGIVALTGVSGWMAWTGFGNVRVDVFLFVIFGWLLSLCLHEYAHALVAYLCGDRGVAERGYLRLNPLKYTSPLLSIVLPIVAVVIGGIGLPGGAVWIDHSYIRSKTQESLISLAGPATNMIFAILIAVPFGFGAGRDLGFLNGQVYGAHANFWIALAALGFLQVAPGTSVAATARTAMSPSRRKRTGAAASGPTLWTRCERGRSGRKARKWWTSRGMSSFRSRSGGSCTGMTLSR